MRQGRFACTIVVCGLMSLLAPGASAALTDVQAQDQTVEDVNDVGAAMFLWLTDQVGFAPRERSRVEAALTIHLPDYPAISHADLEDLLVPQYMQAVPELDGWGHPYDFRLNVANPLGPAIMAIRSPGRDGEFSGDSYVVQSFESEQFDEDVVWADGFFVRWPQPTAGQAFYALPPCRVLDTRSTSALQSGIAAVFHLGGECGIPMSAQAIAVNVTVVAPTGGGHVTLFPEGIPVPETSTITFATGQVRTNNAILALGGATRAIGAWCALAGGGQVHLVVDISGYFE